MVIRVLTCPDCRSEQVIHYGKTTGGFARYRCKACKLTFSDAPERGHTEAFKAQVLASYEERMSMRGIARVYHISRNTLTQWLKEKGGTYRA